MAIIDVIMIFDDGGVAMMMTIGKYLHLHLKSLCAFCGKWRYYGRK